jgi:uncharacterized protein (DUF952 family)
MIHQGKIFHLVTPKRWQKALVEGRYSPESLKTEGFIHCSTWDQLLETANLYFEGEEELVVTFIIEKHVKKTLVWEKSRNDQDFPHLYGEFPFAAVETTRLLVRNAEGVFEMEAE